MDDYLTWDSVPKAGLIRLTDDLKALDRFVAFWAARRCPSAAKLSRWVADTQARLAGCGDAEYVERVTEPLDRLHRLSLIDLDREDALLMAWSDLCNELADSLTSEAIQRIDRLIDPLLEMAHEAESLDDLDVIATTALHLAGRWNEPEGYPDLILRLRELDWFRSIADAVAHREKDARWAGDYNATGGVATRRKIATKAINALERLLNKEPPRAIDEWASARLAMWRPLLAATATEGPASLG